MKTIKVLLSFTNFCFISCADECSVIIPGEDIEDIRFIESYDAPYKSNGIFVNRRRLSHLISTKYEKPGTLAQLLRLSNEHYNALVGRDIKSAVRKAEEMRHILEGQYGFHAVRVSRQQEQKINELKRRSVEQIEMSIPKTTNLTFQTSTPLMQRNAQEIGSLFFLARYLSNTPLFFQDVSYESMGEFKPTRMLSDIRLNLEKVHTASEEILKFCSSKFPAQEGNIRATYEAKKSSFKKYLNDVLSNLQTKKMSVCKAVDKGQISASHRNTCMFNSMFCEDLASGNISSTKLGSIDKAQNYISSMHTLYSPFSKWLIDNPIYSPNQIIKKLDFLKRDRTAEASYSFDAYIEDGKIFPGILADCSALEIQCHSLMMNYIIFPKSRTRAYGDSLLSYYGTGYFGSENFPITAISCSTGHAQALIII